MSDLIAVTIEGSFTTSEKNILKTIMHALNHHYRGHAWRVDIKPGGAVVIKNDRVSNYYGFMIPPHQLHNYKEIRRAALIAGGELLERAHMKRGASNNEVAVKLDGAEKRFILPL